MTGFIVLLWLGKFPFKAPQPADILCVLNDRCRGEKNWMRVLMDRPKECETHAIFIRVGDSGGWGDNGMKPQYFQVSVRNLSVVILYIDFYFYTFNFYWSTAVKINWWRRYKLLWLRIFCKNLSGHFLGCKTWNRSIVISFLFEGT